MQHTDIDATPPGTGPMSHRVGYNRHRATSCRLAARPWSTTPSTFHSCIRAPPSHEVKGPLPPIDRDKGPLTPGTREPSKPQLSLPSLPSRQHQPSGLPNHGDVTLQWSGPPRCDIAVVSCRAIDPQHGGACAYGDACVSRVTSWSPGCSAGK